MKLPTQIRMIVRRSTTVALLMPPGAVAILFFGAAALAQNNPLDAAQAPAATDTGLPTHMPEALRSSVRKVVVIATPSPANQEVTGTYDRETAGLIGGMDEGSRMGTISKDIGGVPISFPIPILTIPGAIYGGISGASKREIQEFRDALTEDLMQAADKPLTNDKLALDVFWGLKTLPSLDAKLFAPTTPVPEDTDAILYVSVNDVTIDVQGKEAILTTSAGATLRRLSDGRDLYQRVVHYRDRDFLENWTADDNALWHDYANFARHYLGREISAEVFDRVELNHELRPRETATVKRVKKDDWRGISQSTTPTVAWDLELLGGDVYGAWTESLSGENISYDLEIYDSHQPVYSESGIADTEHAIAAELEPCKTYRWSVRPSYRVGNEIKFGEWMRNHQEPEGDAEPADGLVGRSASTAAAYLQDFAVLDLGCGRR
jgi:hypothetical protein